MKAIPLSNGTPVLVDDEDYPYLSQYTWYAQPKAGCTCYARRTWYEGGRQHQALMHREILNAQPGQEIDHRDHNGLNNCRSNIWLCTHGQNMHNRKPKSGYHGVTRNGPYAWKAIFCHEKAHKYLGSFRTPQEAALAYNQAVIAAGLADFAPLNVIPEDGRQDA